MVLITGASGGIGSELALRFAKEGMTLALCGRSEEKLQMLLEEVTALVKGL